MDVGKNSSMLDNTVKFSANFSNVRVSSHRHKVHEEHRVFAPHMSMYLHRVTVARKEVAGGGDGGGGNGGSRDGGVELFFGSEQGG